jgi:E3 ubiquitin-protein ligase NEDD4
MAADSLYKRDVFRKLMLGAIMEDQADISSIGFPDPFAVATIDGEQTKTTQVIKRTLNPYWNESFDM